jgi:hypothetical protein
MKKCLSYLGWAPIQAWLSIIILNCSGTLLLGCTVFTATNGTVVLAGNSEDYNNNNTRMWFVPGTSGEFGRVYFGFDDLSPQGGINEPGVFFDCTATPANPITLSLDKPLYQQFLVRKVMAECSTVKDAVAIYGMYNLAQQNMANYQIMFGDALGGSVIVEGDQVLSKDASSPFQVVTNFYQSNPSLGGYPCPRFQTATSILQQAAEINHSLCRNILDTVHQEGAYPTQYSNVYDLKNQIIYLYYFHNFHEYIEISLAQELQKGSQTYRIPELFSRIRLHSPTDGESLTSLSVTFNWEAKNSVTYKLYCSQDPQFKDCVPIEINSQSQSTSSHLLLISLLPALPCVFFRGKKFTSILLLLILFVGLLLFNTCQVAEQDNNPTPEPQNRNFIATIDNLSPASTYYWKITANATADFESQTIVRTFTTP